MVFSPHLLLAVTTVLAALTLGASSASALVISELRLNGTQGQNDEYVELYNETNEPVTVDTPGGWAAASPGGVVRFVIPQGTIIPPGDHYLATNSIGYGLGGYAAGDQSYTTNTPSSDGVALFRTPNPVAFSQATRIDAFGFLDDPPLYREGAGFHVPTGFSLQLAYARSLVGGAPRDTGDNLADFRFMDTNGTDNFTNVDVPAARRPGAAAARQPAVRHRRSGGRAARPHRGRDGDPERRAGLHERAGRELELRNARPAPDASPTPPASR